MSLVVTFVLFPGITQLDLTGPAQILTRLPDAVVHFAALGSEPVSTDCGFGIVPTIRFADIDRTDLICVPGGFGIEAAMADPAFMAEVRRLAAEARYVTSVCTGALVLGAAGLLNGKRATTHWAYHDLLPLAGATPVKARVVRDGDTFSGGGVTAGIDFALVIAAEVAGEETARLIATAVEYAPDPPFGPGDVTLQPRSVADRVTERYRAPVASTRAALQAAVDAGRRS